MERCRCKAKACEQCNSCSRCCPHSSSHRRESRPALTCKCKAKRCPTCGLCSSCCEHNVRKKSARSSKLSGAYKKQVARRIVDSCNLLGVDHALMKELSRKDKSQVTPNPQELLAFITKKVSFLPAIEKRSEIGALRKGQRYRLIELMTVAVKCLIKVFIPVGDIGQACQEVAKFLLKYSSNSSYFPDLKQKDAVIDDMTKVCAKLPSSSLQRRAFTAILSNNLTKNQLDYLVGRFHVTSVLNEEEVQLPTEVGVISDTRITKRQFSRGKRDSILLLAGKELEKSVSSRSQKSPEAASSVVSFLLSKDIISFLSWGNKKLTITLPGDSEKVHIIPALNRTKHLSQLYCEYDNLHKETRERDRVGRSSFIAIAGQLTAKELRRRSAVYEFSNQHGFHNFKRIRSLITTMAEFDSSTMDEETWLQRINSLEAFLRQDFKKHVRNYEDAKPGVIWEVSSDGEFIKEKELQEPVEVCKTHSRLFAFGYAPEGSVSGSRGCSYCAGVVDFFSQLRDELQSMPINSSVREGLGIRLESCERSAKLYMAHQVRTINQADHIDRICSSLDPDQGLLVIDYKQKIAPMEYRESQQNYFGKRGMTWHGSMLTYCEEDGGGKSIHYFDQIIENDTVQDFTSVACCIESAIMCIKKQFPFIRRLVLVSDNAKCYSGNGLLGAVVALSVVTGMKIERIIHTEAGEGKSELDAHFGCAFAWLVRYVDAGNDVLKPSDVVDGLRSYGGIPNSSAHLLTFNVNMGPKALEDLENEIESDNESLPEAPAGRSMSPLSSFLSQLKPKLKGSITQVRDVEIVFTDKDEPAKLLCRAHSGFSTTEAVDVRFILTNLKVNLQTSLTQVVTTNPSGIKTVTRSNEETRSRVRNCAENSTLLDNEAIDLLEMAGYNKCHDCSKFFYSFSRHKCKKAVSISLVPQALSLGLRLIEDKRLGAPDLTLLTAREESSSTEKIPEGFESGWASRPKRAERGKGGVGKDMMDELVKMFELGESGRSKVSPAQAAERLEIMRNPDGSLKFPVIPELSKIMSAFSSIKRKRTLQSHQTQAVEEDPLPARKKPNNKRNLAEIRSNDAADEGPSKKKDLPKHVECVVCSEKVIHVQAKNKHWHFDSFPNQ